MEENIPAFARLTKLYGGQARAATAPEAEVLHLPLLEILLQHPFRKDVIPAAGAGRAATGTGTPADVRATVSLTGHQAVTIVAITIRVPAAHATCLQQAVNRVSLCVITTARVVEVPAPIIAPTAVAPALRVQETVEKATPLIRKIFGMAERMVTASVT